MDLVAGVLLDRRRITVGSEERGPRMTAGVGVGCLSVEDMSADLREFGVKSLRGNTSAGFSNFGVFGEHLIDRMRKMRRNSASETRTFCIWSICGQPRRVVTLLRRFPPASAQVKLTLSKWHLLLMQLVQSTIVAHG